MKEQLLKKLKHPLRSEGLELKDDHILQGTVSQDQFVVKEGIPQLLAAQAETTVRNAALHQNLQSEFNYVDHYQQDALVIDYFTDFEDGPTLHENRRLHEAIIAQVPKEAKEILDIGCGKAWVAGYFAPRKDLVCSFDISTTNTEKAVQTYPVDNHVAVVGDVYHLPFQENTFDALISAEVIEHVPEVEAYLRELIRVCRPGGKIIISTPYDEKIAMHLCVHCNRPTPSHAHLHTFNRAKVAAILEPFKGLKWETQVLSNKALLKLRTHLILQFLPFSLWRMVDRLANRFYKKPTRLLILLEKEEAVEMG